MILLGAANALRVSIGAPLPPLRQVFLEQLKRETQAQLEPVLWDQNWQAGAALPLETVVKHALESHSQLSSTELKHEFGEWTVL